MQLCLCIECDVLCDVVRCVFVCVSCTLIVRACGLMCLFVFFVSNLVMLYGVRLFVWFVCVRLRVLRVRYEVVLCGLSCVCFLFVCVLMSSCLCVANLMYRVHVYGLCICDVS